MPGRWTAKPAGGDVVRQPTLVLAWAAVFLIYTARRIGERWAALVEEVA
ncbi:MAG: hypothetical protein ABI959_13300 [Candidatus Dormiibacterota bacterium]